MLQLMGSCRYHILGTQVGTGIQVAMNLLSLKGENEFEP